MIIFINVCHFARKEINTDLRLLVTIDNEFINIGIAIIQLVQVDFSLE